MEQVLMIFLTVMNLALFAIAAVDKSAAIRHRRRVSEKTLWLGAAFGGAAGLYLAMRLFHHKTKHKSFMAGVPVLIAVHCAVLFVILR